MSDRARLVLGLALLGVAVVALVLTVRRPGQVSQSDPGAATPVEVAQMLTPATATATPTLLGTPTPEPLVPTPLATGTNTPTATPEPVENPTLAPTAEPTGVPATSTVVTDSPAPTPTPLPDPTTQPGDGSPSDPAPESLRSRLGIGVPRGVTEFEFDPDYARRLGLGWYLDWHLNDQPVRSDGLEFVQVIAARGRDFEPNRAYIANVLAATPGSLWFIGNEPDVPWQDNKTPEEYAAIYHQLYTFIKSLDPTAQVAIGGISQVTPLRLRYLDRVLEAYQRDYGQPMPVDVWNIHAFVLREERDSWGVSIPPGFDEDQGMLWEIEDHDNLDLFRRQIVDFRTWMADHGQRDKPLIVSEYGILMPEGYGFSPESVAAFMEATFDYLLNAKDADLGYPANDNRLVQRLAWYSYSDTVYPTGNLVDPDTGEFTLLGETFAAYAASLDAE